MLYCFAATVALVIGCYNKTSFVPIVVCLSLSLVKQTFQSQLLHGNM